MTTYRLTKRGRIVKNVATGLLVLAVNFAVLGLAVYVLAAYIASGVHR